MPTAVLSEEEKNRIRHHTGYLVTNPVVSIQLGVPRASQPMFLLESAMNNLPDAAVGQIRRYVAIMDGIEQKLVEAQDRLAADKIGEITLRTDEPGQLEREYVRWARRLADDLGIPLNVYCERFRSARSGGMNIQVVN